MSGQTYHLNEGYHTLSTASSPSSTRLGVRRYFSVFFFSYSFLRFPSRSLRLTYLCNMHIYQRYGALLYCCHSFTFYLQQKWNEMNRHPLENNGVVNMRRQLFRRHCHWWHWYRIRLSALNGPTNTFIIKWILYLCSENPLFSPHHLQPTPLHNSDRQKLWQRHFIWLKRNKFRREYNRWFGLWRLFGKIAISQLVASNPKKGNLLKRALQFANIKCKFVK